MFGKRRKRKAVDADKALLKGIARSLRLFADAIMALYEKR